MDMFIRYVENFKDLKEKLKESKLLKKMGPREMAMILKESNLFPMFSMAMFTESLKAQQQIATGTVDKPKGALKDRIRDYVFKEQGFASVIKAWEKTIQDLVRLTSCIREHIKDKKVVNYQMLGVIAALAYIYHTYTAGSIMEKVLGIALGYYARDSKFGGQQIAKMIDVVTRQFPELDLPSGTTSELYKANRESYFSNLVHFYSGVLSAFPVSLAAESFYFVFTPPETVLDFAIILCVLGDKGRRDGAS